MSEGSESELEQDQRVLTRAKAKTLIRNRPNMMETLLAVRTQIIWELKVISDDLPTMAQAVHAQYSKRVSTLFSQAETNLTKILKHAPSNEHNSHREEFANIMRLAMSLLSSFDSPPVPASPAHSWQSANGSAASVAPAIKLPPIELPTFNGKEDQWPIFSANFKNVLAHAPHLSEEDKLIYLQSAMREGAKQIIAYVMPGPTAFREAWDLLEQRYKNQRHTIFSIVRKIISYTPPRDNRGLQRFIDDMRSYFSTLTLLGLCPEDGAYFWDTILLDKVDQATNHAFEQSLKDDKIPKIQGLLTFLHNRVQVANNTATSAPAYAVQPVPTFTQQPVNAYPQQPAISKGHQPTFNAKPQQFSNKCPECSLPHTLYRCPVFLKANVDERWILVKKHKRCGNCLQPIHGKPADCQKGECRECGLKHFTSLHKKKEPPKTNCATSEKIVLLQTAIIHVQAKNGNVVPFRALLDSGSTASIITNSALASLNLKPRPADTHISGVGCSKNTVNKMVDLTCTSVKGDFFTTFSAYVMPIITDDMPMVPIVKQWPHIAGLELADPNFHTPAKVDILLGADIMNKIMCPSFVDGASGPRAQLTRFGWVLQGPVGTDNQPLQPHNTNAHTICSTNYQNKYTGPIPVPQDQFHADPTPGQGAKFELSPIAAPFMLHPQGPKHTLTVTHDRPDLCRFWELEELPYSKILTPEERRVEQLFKSTTTIAHSGRYCVKLPLRSNPPNLGEGRSQALARFKALERKFQKDSIFHKAYTDTIADYINTGHMLKVTPNAPDAVYLPHHGIKNNNKLRIVFDASAKTSNGRSLNEEFMNGPKTQPELFEILVRFRTYEIALIADIKQMYRQVDVYPEDYHLQTIIWRNAPNKPLEEYQLTVVTWGTKPASYLATRVLNDIADRDDSHPLAASRIQHDFYVDDFLSGANSLTEAQLVKSQTEQLLSDSGFTLHKWASSEASLLSDVDTANLKATIISEPDMKTLGVKWHPQEDSFSLVFAPFTPSTCTKRTVLSEAGRVFDPLGWISPAMLRAKLLIQRLWRDTIITWDSRLPPKVTSEWSEFMAELQKLQAVKIPRRVTSVNAVQTMLCGFCDASEVAYAAVVYVRQRFPDGSFRSSLLAAKTKVAPTSITTLPRLELCGALLLARLMKKLSQSIQMQHEVIAFSDSSVALYWLKNHPSRWKIFVAHRVQEIQNSIPADNWFHVPSQQNIADIASRGVSPQDLVGNEDWWTGPAWLRQADFMSIPNSTMPSLNVVPEEKPQKNIHVLTFRAMPVLSKISSLPRMIRTIAYVRRFCTPSANRPTGPITGEEYRSARFTILRNIQKEFFYDEIQAVLANKPLKKSSILYKYAPFIGSDGMLRIGGRLRHSNLPEDAKHPIIVPYRHPLAKTIVRHLHETSEHAGPQLLTSIVQQQYYIPKIRNLARLVTRTCVTCCRLRAKTASQLMSDLPAVRITPSRPFSSTGVDMAGPVNLRTQLSRGTKHYKAYIAIYVCMATRSLHLELVTSMSAEGFLAAFHRFCARRGTPSRMFSDRGTNFTATSKLFKKIQDDETVQAHLASKETKWIFNPPGAPHWGGLWEAGVKSTKFHLFNIVKDHVLTYEEMSTVLCRVEAVLNSRPLTTLSDDPDDLQALTPAHFLVGSALTSPPETPCDEKLLPNQRWLLVQQIAQHFWKRWSSEYLTRLQQRPKWCTPKPGLQINDLVVIKEDNMPPLQWRMGRILKIHPSKDGLARAATVRTQFSTYERPITKLCPLPLDGNPHPGPAEESTLLKSQVP